MSFLDTPELIRKSQLMGGIISALRDLPKERGLQVLLMWFSVEELEYMYPTVTGGPLPDAETTE